MASNRIAIIIPCYNEESRLQKDKFISFAEQHSNIDLWFINDGSKDNTFEMLQQMSYRQPDRLFVHNLLENKGKAEAIRQGMLLLTKNEGYDYIGFLDADLSAPLEEAIPLVQVIIQHQLLLVAGARIKLLGKQIIRSPLRHYLGRIFATYYVTLLNLPNYDTQCGLKIFERKFASKLFATTFVSNWFFDIELFLRARIEIGQEQYEKKLVEVPLSEWKEVKGSKLKLTDFVMAPFEVLKIYNKYKDQNKDNH